MESNTKITLVLNISRLCSDFAKQDLITAITAYGLNELSNPGLVKAKS